MANRGHERRHLRGAGAGESTPDSGKNALKHVQGRLFGFTQGKLSLEGGGEH